MQARPGASLAPSIPARARLLSFASVIATDKLKRDRTMRTQNRRLAFIAGMVISAVFLVLAFRGLQPDQFWASLGDVDQPLLLGAALVYFLAMLIIAWRWQILLHSVKRVPLAALFKLVAIGYMGNNVYPLRAGDGLRIVLLRREHQVALLRATTVIAVEHLYNGTTMIVFILLGLAAIDLESPTVEALVGLTMPLVSMAIVAALFLAAKPALLRRLVRWAVAILPPALGQAAQRLSEDVIAGLEGLRSSRHFLGALLASFLTWGVEAGTYWLVMFAFGLELNYAVALLLVGAVNLAGLIPASPGQVGVNEFVVITILTALGLPAASATAYAVVIHLVIWLPPTLLGFAFLLRHGFGLADIRQARDAQTQASDLEPRA